MAAGSRAPLTGVGWARPRDTETSLMQRALSTHLFVNHRLTTVWLERIWSAGIPLVEIFCAPQHLDCHNRMQISELGHWFRDSQLQLHSLHAPMDTDEILGRSGPQAAINITAPAHSK